MLAPLDGRYKVQGDGDVEGVLVFQPGSAPARRQFQRRRLRSASPEQESVPVSRVTVVAAERMERTGAERWLTAASARGGGEEAIENALATVNRALHAFAAAASDPYVRPIRREDCTVIRLGFGTGPEVAEGGWTEAAEARARSERRSAHDVDAQHAVTEALTGRAEPTPAESIALRARQELEVGRPREAALAVRAAAEALVAEGRSDANELHASLESLGSIASRAATRPLSVKDVAAVHEALTAIRRVLRRRRASV